MQNTLTLLDDFFQRNDFLKKTNYWRKPVNDCIIVCNWQKSRFDEYGFLNFGLYYPSLASKKTKSPKISECHIEGRFKTIIGEPKSIESIPLNPDSDQELNMVVGVIDKIDQIVLPYLYKYSVLNDLRADLRDGNFDFSKMLVGIEY